MGGTRRLLAALAMSVALAGPAAAAFVTFESGQVRPLALSPDGSRLYAVNTPDDQLEIFAVNGGDLVHIGSVPVGLEPVAVAARSNDEVWVVNHLSDSVSVVDVGATPPRVARTLLVGDEPRDIVFAGPTDAGGHFTRAFITTARRGQNLPASLPAALTTPGTPRALVWVFDAATPDDTLTGTPLTVVALFGDTPRALATTPDGHTVYAAIFHSGNQTASVAEGAVCDGGAAAPPCALDGVQVPGGLSSARVPGGLPAPNANDDGVRGPEVGLIVKLNPVSGLWEDELGRNWTNAVRFDLPDRDVFAIDALADPPVESNAFAHVGTVLFNMVVNPSNGALYVSNTEARNQVRFEGPGTNATTVRGHLHEARITVIAGNSVTPHHLNKHVTALPQGYRTVPMPPGVKDASLATPVGMAVSSTGTLYVAAFGSSAIGRFDASALEQDSFTPAAADHIQVSGGGPSGLALDEPHQRLYVLTRFDDAVKVIDTASNTEIAQHPLHNPEPAAVVQGRHFLYDARSTSSNGEAACGSCHVFGDFDSLGWDLGNPDGQVAQSFNPIGPIGGGRPFHPLKGPMTTQTLRGMAHDGPMHWRGDRNGGMFPGDPRAEDEHLAFEAFNVAFDSLLGRDEGPIPAADMQAFTDFILTVTLPPNPNRSLDNQLTTAQANGRDTFFNLQSVDAVSTCNGCHMLDPSQGFFGTSGLTTFETETQEFKVPHLANVYQKIGMFGMPSVPFASPPLEHRQPQGEQVRGFGLLHDGSVATVLDFLHANVFFLDEGRRQDLEQFILAFDTTFAPIVGQQATLTSTNAAAVGARIDLLIARARTSFVLVDQPEARECDLVAKGIVGGEARGYLLNPASGLFQSDRAAEAPLTDAALRAAATASGQELTYTCAPPGSGLRIGLDRDEDGFFDRDEIDAGSDPADPQSTPAGGTPTPTPSQPTNQTPTSTPTETPSAIPFICPGDCTGNRIVTIDDLVRGVAIALEAQPLSACSSFDTNGDGQVSVDELIQAVKAALDGCPQPPIFNCG
jgi:DNA-binding beta-propeller fold protein YncE